MDFLALQVFGVTLTVAEIAAFVVSGVASPFLAELAKRWPALSRLPTLVCGIVAGILMLGAWFLIAPADPWRDWVLAGVIAGWGGSSGYGAVKHLREGPKSPPATTSPPKIRRARGARGL